MGTCFSEQSVSKIRRTQAPYSNITISDSILGRLFYFSDGYNDLPLLNSFVLVNSNTVFLEQDGVINMTERRLCTADDHVIDSSHVTGVQYINSSLTPSDDGETRVALNDDGRDVHNRCPSAAASAAAVASSPGPTCTSTCLSACHPSWWLLIHRVDL